MLRHPLKWLFIPTVITLCCLLSHCGFRLKHQNQLPPNLRCLYVSSNQPYDRFTTLLNQNLLQRKVKLTKTAKEAPVILKIEHADLVYSLPDITTSDKARSYTLTYQVRFLLLKSDGAPLLPTQSITVQKPLTLNPGQTLYSNNELALVKREMQKEAITLLLYRLEAQKVRDALQ